MDTSAVTAPPRHCPLTALQSIATVSFTPAAVSASTRTVAVAPRRTSVADLGGANLCAASPGRQRRTRAETRLAPAEALAHLPLLCSDSVA